MSDQTNANQPPASPNFGANAQQPPHFGGQPQNFGPNAQQPSDFGANAQQPQNFGTQPQPPQNFAPNAQQPQGFGAQPQPQPPQNFGPNAQQPPQGGYNPYMNPAAPQPQPGNAPAGNMGNSQFNAYGSNAGSQEEKTLSQQLRSIGFSLLGIGLLLALWNVINSLSAIPVLGFFESYFLVESPIHAIQAYGSILGIVGGIGLVIASAAVNKK